jgi:hypothetical protein
MEMYGVAPSHATNIFPRARIAAPIVRVRKVQARALRPRVRFHRQIHHRPKNSCQNLSPAKVTINVHAMDEKMMQAMKAWSLL